jgi:hypothetical protein
MLAVSPFVDVLGIEFMTITGDLAAPILVHV